MSRGVDLSLIATADGRYQVEAFEFVAEGLARGAELAGKTKKSGELRHLTAAELVQGCVDLAAERWSCLGDLVLESIGIQSPADIGNITFAMISHGIFTKEPEDTLADFLDVSALRPAVEMRMRVRAGVWTHE